MFSSKQGNGNTLTKLPLQTTLVVPLVLQIFAAVGLVGYLSFRNGQKAVNELVVRLQNEANYRIEQHLSNYLNTAKQVAKINTDALELGLLDPKNLKAQGQFYWKQLQEFNVGYISFGSTIGDYIGSGYQTDTKLVINEASVRLYGNSNATIYTTDGIGNRIQPGENVGKYEFQTQNWYADTIKTGRANWSPIYQWAQPPNPIAVSFNRPVRDRNNNIIGAIGIDQRLSQISDFLRELKVSPSGKIFIIERSGLIVASSTTEPPFTMVNGQPKRLQVLDSKDPLIGLVAPYLQKTLGNFSQIKDSQQLQLRVNNGNFPWQSDNQFIQVTPWQDKFGLDWLIVTIMPESDFTAQINANMRNTFVLCILALVVAIIVAIYTARWITRPLIPIAKASEEMANGNFEQQIETNQILELAQVANSFNKMASQLKSSFAFLNSVIDQANLVSTKVTTSTSQIAESGKQLEATALQQASSINQVNETAHAIAKTSGQLVKTMENVTQQATATASLTSTSQKSLTEMAAAMVNLATATKIISSWLGVMNEKANNITTVVKRISEVADRTNLMSLNAAIEAEKAGQYGAGFAIVAREVRQLADNAAVASQEIEEMVVEMQSTVSKGVMEMDNFSHQVQHHVELVSSISEQIAQVIERVQSLTPQFEQVSHSVQTQFQGAQQISSAISQLSKASHQTVASLQDTNQALEQLNDTAQILKETISGVGTVRSENNTLGGQL